MAKFRKGDAVTDVDRETRYLVERAHRDGSYTVRAMFGLRKDGTDRSGYLGYTYTHIPARALRPIAEQVSA